MRRSLLRAVCAVCLSLCWAGAAATSDAGRPSETELDAAQEKLVAYLYDREHTGGGWFKPYDQSPRLEDPKHDGGLTALVVLALLSAGESPQAHPGLARGLAYLERLQDEHLDVAAGTYPIGVRAQVWAMLPERYLPRLETDMRRLARGAGVGGLFSYLLDEPPTREADYNHSTTQYGAVGLAAASSRGLRVPDKLWKRMAEHFLRTQHRNGGWSYSAAKPPTNSMTCAGIKVLQTVQRELRRGQTRPDSKLQEAIERGLGFLDQHYQPREANRGGLGAYGYAIQRVGEATGVTAFGGNDWYADHAHRILDTASRPSSVATAAYDLMFLARGRRPAVLGKLRMDPGRTWNRRPNDLHYAAEALGRTFEQEVRWSLVDPAVDPPQEAPPLLFWSVNRLPELDSAKIAWLRSYFQRGGLLVINPERGASRTADAVRVLARTLDPTWQVEAAATTHPVMQLWREVPNPERLNVLRVHNGVRDLILCPQQDWGMVWQRGRARDGDAGDAASRTAARGLANLFLFATEHGSAMPQRPTDAAPKTAAPVMVRRPTGGPEPHLWTVLADRLSVARSEEAPAVGQGLLHLTEGADPDDAVEAALAHARAGGTVLIESLGGRGELPGMLEPLLAARLGMQGRLLPATDPLLVGIPIAYRRFTARHASRPDAARLVVFDVDLDPEPAAASGAPPKTGTGARVRAGRIVLSAEDLSLAAAGVHQWGLHGYAPRTARLLLRRLLDATPTLPPEP